MNLRVMGAAVLLGTAAYGMSGPAMAADLGGGCCADLEERVAELEATTARKGNRRVSLTISGQVTQALMFWDDGEDSDVYVIDPQTSNSRFRFTGSAKVSPSLSAGFNIEIAAGLSAKSNDVTQIDDDTGSGDGDGDVQIRKAYWYLNHRQLGRLSVGRLSMASDGVAQIDLGGANIVAQSGLYYGNDFEVGGIGATGTTWGQLAGGNFNFELDRNNAVRYDTANIGGFVGSASFGENDRWDATLRYAGEFGGFRLAAGIGYGYGDDNSDEFGGFEDTEREFVTGSASLLHVGTGLFVSGSASTRDTEADDGDEDFTEDSWSVRGGVSKNYFGIGKTVLYGEYHTIENGGNLDATMDIWGLGVVQNIDAASMELFAAYKNYSVDDFGDPDAEDLDLVITGARIKF